MTTSTLSRSISTSCAASAAPARQRRTTADASVRAAVFCSATDDWPTPYYGLDHADPSRRDGLAGDWAADATELGGSAWCNAPYARGVGAWVAKAAATAAAGVTVVALLPARTDTAWFHDHVLAHGAEVRYVRGRLKFGEATSSAPFANLVVIFHAAPQGPAKTEQPAPSTAELATTTPSTRQATDAPTHATTTITTRESTQMSRMRGRQAGRAGAATCQLTDSAGMVQRTRTSVRRTGSLPLPCQSAGNEGEI